MREDLAAPARLARRASYVSVAVALFLLVIKGFAGVVTGSVALLGSFVDSLLDLAASTLNALALREASLPADREHRFGHGKAEAIAGLGQAALIAGSAAFLLFESVQRLVVPAPLSHSAVGIAVILVSMAVTIALVVYQRRVVRRTGSLAISADQLHYRGDILMNASVIGALVAGGVYGLTRVDAAVGLLVGIYIGFSAWKIARLAYDQLMDHELAEKDRARIKDIVARHAGVRAMHDLRTRRSGFDTFIQLHIELDPQLSLLRAHEISDGVEADIRTQFPNAEVIIHEDPAGFEKPHSIVRR